MRYNRSFVLLLPLLVSSAWTQTTSYLIDSIGATPADPASSTAAFDDIRGLAADSAGNVYLSDAARHRVYRITPAGVARSIAGTGVSGFSGDGGPAESAQLNSPYGVAVDLQGNVYIADLGNARVRRISLDGTIRTVAGGGRSAVTASAQATDTVLKAPRNVAVDPAGTMYISDFQDHRVLRVASDGRLAVLAGTGAPGPALDTTPLAATLNFPAGLTVDSTGALYLADSANHAIRRFTAAAVSTVRVQFSEQNVNLPTAVALDTAGNVHFVAAGFENLVRVSSAGVPTVIASGGIREVAVSPLGVVFCATSSQVRRLSTAGQWTPVTTGTAVTQFLLGTPEDVEIDSAGGLLIADSGGNRVHRILSGGTPVVVAGTGEAGFSGDNGQALSARLSAPQGVAAGPGGAVYIADTNSHRVRRVEANGVIRTVAGTGVAGNSLDARLAVQAGINAPTGIAVDAAGDVWFADTGNHMIRRLTTSGMLLPLAGNGLSGFRGDGAAATAAQLSAPRGIAFDRDGGLLIADSGNHRIRKISASGLITTIAGTGTAGFSGDGAAARSAALSAPSGVAVDSSGLIYIADSGNQRLRRIALDGTITTIAGSGVRGFAGDQGPALSARLDSPVAVAVSSNGTVYLADRGNQKVRQLTLSPGSGGTGGTGDLPDLRVLHAATLESTPVAPGMLLALLGTGIGPSTPFSGRITPGGTLETALGGAQVRFDGIAAPLLYAQDNMIHLQVPYRLPAAGTTRMEIVRDGAVRAAVTLPVAAAVPGIFATAGGTGLAAAINEDSSLMSEASPALRGGTLTFFATGEGAVTPAATEGRLSESPYPLPVQALSVRIGQVTAELISAAASVTAPGLMQVTVRVPRTVAAGSQTLQLSVGTASSQSSVTVFVR